MVSINCIVLLTVCGPKMLFNEKFVDLYPLPFFNLTNKLATMSVPCSCHCLSTSISFLVISVDALLSPQPLIIIIYKIQLNCNGFGFFKGDSSLSFGKYFSQVPRIGFIILIVTLKQKKLEISFLWQSATDHGNNIYILANFFTPN